MGFGTWAWGNKVSVCEREGGAIAKHGLLDRLHRRRRPSTTCVPLLAPPLPCPCACVRSCCGGTTRAWTRSCRRCLTCWWVVCVQSGVLLDGPAAGERPPLMGPPRRDPPLANLVSRARFLPRVGGRRHQLLRHGRLVRCAGDLFCRLEHIQQHRGGRRAAAPCLLPAPPPPLLARPHAACCSSSALPQARAASTGGASSCWAGSWTSIPGRALSGTTSASPPSWPPTPGASRPSRCGAKGG